MSGQYSGLQARIKLLNELVEWNLCSGHSLNLVGVHAVGSCSEASNFFAIVQSVYNFFSTSMHRWASIKRCAQEKSLTLKSLSTTRWSARADVDETRDQFDYYEKRALNMSEIKEYRSETKRQGKRKLKADETRDGELELSARDKFRVDAFNVILDDLLSELNSRCASYTEINEKFVVITKFQKLIPSELREKSESLRLIYDSDLESTLGDEFVHFHAYCVIQSMEKSSPLELLQFLRDNDLNAIYPNVEIAYRMFICMTVTNCSAERSFSCLKRIKTYLSSTMTENRLNSLALLCIESEILRSLDFKDVIKNFSEIRARRKGFRQ
ncbi:uncharacterized protein LOC117173669 [Belonocnema kinseyi]|uniref:uncharacterized protein LOC117173669 n=1 Tax=Belonocnema kinseyi TaxID=2817044 RepID=UPI00143CEEEA|nr:uncharacterized protein LOC117173669 [Belonocnema kinseyi]